MTNDRDSEFFFLRSRKATFVAEGCYRRIATPSVDGADLNGKFQNSIRLAVAEARSAGIEDPLIVGAIPFDPSQPSQLYIPKSWHKQDDATTMEHAKQSTLESYDIVASQLVPEHDEFTGIVAEAVNEIRAGKLKKVVLSRLRNITTAKPIDSRGLLTRLILQNPTGFNFHVPLSDGTRLIGSSPELLLQKEGDTFCSQPLAGSAGRKKDSEAEDEQVAKILQKSPKDLHEHKLVVDSVRETLAPRSEKLEVPEAPECICTPKLWHLASSIKGKVANLNENALSLASLLHPTPALSGFPHELSMDLLSHLEPFDREYFGGIVGYCDSNGDGEWFITIRCGRLSESSIQLFAGAGIVGDSDPESEWRETGIKLSTMLQAFDMI